MPRHIFNSLEESHPKKWLWAVFSGRVADQPKFGLVGAAQQGLSDRMSRTARPNSGLTDARPRTLPGGAEAGYAQATFHFQAIPVRNPFVVALRVTRALIFPALLALSIAFNLALLLSTSLYGLASSGLEALTGRRSPVVQQADDLARASADLDVEKGAHREVRSELAETQADLLAEKAATRELRSELTEASAELAGAQAELATERVAIREIRTQLLETSGELALARAAQSQVRGKVAGTASAVTQRAAKTATREVASMPGEALPWVGTAVIIGATALELADLCATIKDMTALQHALDPDYSAPEEQLTVCAMEVPSRKALMQMAIEAPGKAWAAAAERVPDIANTEIPDFDWEKSKVWFSEAYATFSESASTTSGDFTDWVVRWWSGDERE